MSLTRGDELMQAVQARLAADRRIGDAAIDVEAPQEGEVRLLGEVPSQEVKDAAEAIARAVPGVVLVINALRIPSEAERANEETVPRAPRIDPDSL